MTLVHQPDLIVLDEITYPITYGWLAVEEVVETLRDRPEHVDIIMTGRDAHPALIEFADTVTEMVTAIKALGPNPLRETWAV